jgi:Ca-activated chloride channel family protein
MTAALLLAALTAGPPVFRAAIEKVYVDAFVTRGGRPVTGLKVQDFELRDDAVPQAVELVALEQAPLSIVLALDTSGSVAGTMLEALRAAGHALVDGLPPWDHMALLSFNHLLELRAAATTDRRPLHHAVDLLEAQGSTALRDAIYAAIRLSAPDDRRVVVVFSDGADNLSWLSADDVREASQKTGTTVYAISHTPESKAADPLPFGAYAPQREDGSTRELRLLAESTGGMFLEAADPASVRARFKRIIEEMSTRYLLAFVPTVRREGEHRLDLKVRSGKGSVRYRRSYVVTAR